MEFLVNENTTADPSDVGLFGSKGVMLDTNELSNLSKQLLGGGFKGSAIITIPSVS
jgi:hypothetical protein